MKLVERFVVKKRYYEDHSVVNDIVNVFASTVLMESEDLLAIGSYINEEITNFDCNKLLKSRGVLEDEDYCIVYTKMLSDYHNLTKNDDNDYYMNKEILIEK